MTEMAVSMNVLSLLAATLMKNRKIDDEVAELPPFTQTRFD